FSQKPSVKRPPERSGLSSPFGKSTAVPGAPRTPAMARGVAAGLVVTRGGRGSSLIHHRRYSPRNHSREQSGTTSSQRRYSHRRARRRGASQQRSSSAPSQTGAGAGHGRGDAWLTDGSTFAGTGTSLAGASFSEGIFVGVGRGVDSG